MNNDLFKVGDDLPDDLVKQLMKGRAPDNPIRIFIMGLFDLKNKISINDIMISYYRKNTIVLMKKQVQQMIYYLVSIKQIVRDEKEPSYFLPAIIRKKTKDPLFYVPKKKKVMKKKTSKK